ncbi:MAG: hypothetical protein GY715_19350 [Planctomycetes bacterium]|nr:hypothetical protein [Planctomycetota bacterium]
MPVARMVTAILLAANAATGAWVAAPSFPDPGEGRLWAAGLNHQGTLFVIGGSPFGPGTDTNAAVHVLAPGGGAWEEGAWLENPIVRQAAGVDALGRIIVFGGRDGLDPEGDLGQAYVYELDEGQQGWISQRTEAAPFDYVAAATDDQGRVYSIGGGPGAGATPADPNLAHVERYVAATDTWDVIAPMLTPVADATAVHDGQGHVVVIGGFDQLGTTRSANVARYDIVTNTWSNDAVPDLPEARTGMRAVLGADDRIYVLGGVAGPVGTGVTRSTTYVLDPDSGTWLPGPPMATPRSGFAVALGDDDHIYAMGGMNDTGGTALVEKLYTPPCPTMLVNPQPKQPWQGQTAVLSATVGGGTPISYQWRADGTPLVDGPAPGGGTISGATTSSLTITAPTPADDASYDLVATNACGSVTSAPAALAVRVPPTLPAAWTVTNLHPAWALSSSAGGTTGSTQTGTARMDTPEYDNIQRPVLWEGTAASAIDLTPPLSAGGSASATAGDFQVGWWWWPYQCQIGGQWYTCYSRQACAWSGTSGSYENLQYSGWEYSIASDTDGTIHVGTISTDDAVGNTFAHAGYWSPPNYSFHDMHPAGVSKSFANAIDGAHQYGSIHTPFPGPTTHAARWSGTAASFVDLHPPGASRSWITSANDGQQVGMAEIAGVLQPGLWADAATSFQPMTPSLATSAGVNTCAGGLQAGSAVIDSAARAVVWRGSPDDFFDLHAFLPPEFSGSGAYGLHVDETTDVITVVGFGYNATTARQEALMWRSEPASACPADLDGSGDVGFGDILQVIGAWGPCGTPCPQDLSGNGNVDFADILAVIGAWGSC